MDLQELTAQVIRFTWISGFLCLDNLNSCSSLVLCSIQLPVNGVKEVKADSGELISEGPNSVYDDLDH